MPKSYAFKIGDEIIMYVYRFLNSDDKIIYIGKAKDLKSRFSSHNHLPKECYIERIKIQYVKLSNSDEASIYERYLINKISPKYNTQYNNNSSFMFESITCLSFFL